MRELTFEEISVVSGGGNFFTDLFRNPSKLIREGLGQQMNNIESASNRGQSLLTNFWT